MKTPEFKKTFRDTPKSQDTLINTAIEIATLKGSQESHIIDSQNTLEEKINYQKELIEDYHEQIKNLEKKQEQAEDIFTIAHDPEKFIDADTKSKEDIQKIIDEMSSEKRKETTFMNRLKIQLAKIKDIMLNIV